MFENEIRIDKSYTTILKSDIPDGKEELSEPISIEDMIPTSRFLEKINRYYEQMGVIKVKDENFVYPPNCRFIKSYGNRKTVVIEEPPMIRTIKIQMYLGEEVDVLKKFNKLEEYGYTEAMCKEYKSNGRIHTLSLAFPFTIFLLTFDQSNRLLNGQVYLRNSRLVNNNDYLFKMPMLNISSKQGICFGQFDQSSHTTLSRATENTIFHYWSNIFTTDYSYNYEAYKEVTGINTYLGWQGLTAIDPMFIYSVNWVKYEKTINNLLNEIEKSYESSPSRAKLTYETLRLIHKTSITSTEIKTNPKTKVKKKLIYDVKSGIELTPQNMCHIGDRFKIKNGQILTIDSFISFEDDYKKDVSRIKVITETGKSFLLLNNSKIRNIIFNGMNELSNESKGYFKNGVEVKPNDIVMLDINGQTIYQKIYSIRKSRIGDNYLEAKMTDNFFILNNINGTIYNMTDETIGGEVLKENDIFYYLSYKNEVGYLFHRGNYIKFLETNVKSNSLVYNFGNLDETVMTYIPIKKIDLENRILIRNKDIRKLPNVFVHERKIFAPVVYKDKEEPTLSVLTPYGVLIHGFCDDLVSKHGVQSSLTSFLNKDKTEFNVQTTTLNISFKVNDKVVVSNWTQPEEMLNIKRITAITNDDSKITFELVDKTGIISKHVYVDVNENTVRVGSMRKIVNQINDYKTGDKIKAKDANIAYFPKKSTNIIIGFLIDCIEPQVLCSNCLTIKLSDMEKFNIIPYGTKAWNKTIHDQIEVNKIKCQPGDIIQGINHYKVLRGYKVMCNKSGNLKLLEINKQYYDDYELRTLPKDFTQYFTFDYFLSPRINLDSTTKRNKYIPGYYTEHGDFIKVDKELTNYTYGVTQTERGE